MAHGQPLEAGRAKKALSAQGRWGFWWGPRRTMETPADPQGQSSSSSKGDTERPARRRPMVTSGR